MNLTDKSIIKGLLKKYDAKPEKHLGQHFILSKKALDSMIAAAEIKQNDTIVEIGPGLGTLTQELAATGAKITAIEKDLLMVNILKETLNGYKNIRVTQADALHLSILRIDKIIDSKNRYKRYKIVANLPYNAATFLIRQWLGSKTPPELMVLMIQKEVAQRIIANPPHSNLLAVSVQFYANTEIIDYVKKESFWPQPKVDAAIIKIIPKKVTFPRRSLEERHFFEIVKAGFSSPRKQLAGNLSKKLDVSKENIISIFKDLKISTTARAENLSLNQWQKLSKVSLPDLSTIK